MFEAHFQTFEEPEAGVALSARLAALREELARRKLTGFVIPRADQQQNEYVAPSEERLAWLTGFTGSAGLAVKPAGQNEITALAVTVKDIAAEIPPDIHWVLRVDGHTDKQPIKSAQFASNWELSMARAITVVRLLIADGVPADHLAATGFADNQPLDPADTPDAYAKNRRIELRLTDR